MFQKKFTTTKISASHETYIAIKKIQEYVMVYHTGAIKKCEIDSRIKYPHFRKLTKTFIEKWFDIESYSQIQKYDILL